MEINTTDINKLYEWVVSPIYNEVNESLKNELLDKFEKLPNQITNGEARNYNTDELITAMFNHIEYSSNKRFYFLNNHRRRIYTFAKIVLYVSIGLLAGTIIVSRFVNDVILYILFCGFVVLLGVSVFSLEYIKKLFDKIAATMKPGDLIKILNDKDENVPITRMENTLGGPDKYKEVTVVESKKAVICKKYREFINTKYTRNLYNLVMNFIATDYLMKTCLSKDDFEYYCEENIKTLKNLLVYRSDNRFLLYNLGIYALNLLQFNNSKYYFNQCKAIDANEVNVNSWLIVIDFILSMEAETSGLV
ncbi:hypothetical protein FACS1894130_07720 [Spirochaetia bacterium]|nr:hypothetical protein FACS1894130_07720 [Spirochaetia bacterium]